jgi:hypothetical protein
MENEEITGNWFINNRKSPTNNASKVAENEPLEVTGQIGLAQEFDGQNDKLTIPSHFDHQYLFSFDALCLAEAGSTTRTCWMWWKMQ